VPGKHTGDSSRLDEYERKRSFDQTPEPRGDTPPDSDAGNRFVIQEHHARRLHWDFRLERGGVLVSWAVPRGLPDTPNENRLAVHTEDHPLEYLTFEDVIPSGYGAGQVKIWDSGTYETEKFTDDKVIVRLHGERVRGKYALFRTHKEWLIHRMDPPEPDYTPLPEPFPPMLATPAELPDDEANWAFEVHWDGVRALAYSEYGRLRLLASESAGSDGGATEGGATDGGSISSATARASGSARDGSISASDGGGRASSASSADDGGASEGGSSVSNASNGGGTRASSGASTSGSSSRSGGGSGDGSSATSATSAGDLLDLTKVYPEVSGLAIALGGHRAVFDGMVVAFDPAGQPSFTLLERRMHLTSDPHIKRARRETPVTYIVFDLLYLDGRSLLDVPYAERRRELEALELTGPHWQVPGYQAGEGGYLLEAGRRLGLPGIIAKRLDSGYEQGARSGAWLSIPSRQDLNS
jgi:DNA ligase D-like protein (predicted 3'-phosphoesterase)